MLIPIVCLWILISIILIILGASKKNLIVFVILSVVMWLTSILSAFFIGWAWSERAYSENWTMYGVIAISLPIIVVNSILAIASLIVISNRRILNSKLVCQNFYLLLHFLAAQVIIGIYTVK